jgi:hypothetical protein
MSWPEPHPLPLTEQTWPLAQQMLVVSMGLKQQLRPAGQQPAAPQTAPLQHWPSRQVDPLAQVPQLTIWPQLFRANPQVLPAQVVARLSGVQHVPFSRQTSPAAQQASPQRQSVPNPPGIVSPTGQAATHVPQQRPPVQQSPSLSQLSPGARHAAWQIRSTHAPEQQSASAWQVFPLVVQQVPLAPQRCVPAQQVLAPLGAVQIRSVGQQPSPMQTDPAGQQVPPVQARSAGQQLLNPTHRSPAAQQKPTTLLTPMPQVCPAGQQVPPRVQNSFAPHGAHAAPPWPHVVGDCCSWAMQLPLLSQQPLGQVVASQGVTQAPSRHAWPSGQAAPVAPQTQFPSAQVSAVAPQATQPAPQAVGSLSPTQLPPQRWEPWSQTNPQAPPVQVAVALAGGVQSLGVQQSVAGMQASPQPFCPLGQQRLLAQLPEAHCALRSHPDPSARSPTQSPAAQ